MKFKKTMVASACALGFGLGASVASASDIIDMTLMDYDSDGLSSDFAFFAAPTGSGANQWASGGGDGVTFLTNGTSIANGVMSTGFNFGGTGIFSPRVFSTTAGGLAGGDGISGTLNTGALTASWSAVHLGGNFPFLGVTSNGIFNLPPDSLAGISTVVDDLTGTLGAGKYGVVITYIGTITDAGSFINFPANWRLEGVVTVGTHSAVPVPAAAWLFGSGLIGLVGVARRRRKQA